MTDSSEKYFAVFPGQGSQFVGMGKDFYEQFECAKRLYEEASDALSIDMRKLCHQGDEAQLQKTEYTQPALLLNSIAACKILQNETGFSPSIVAGHSLGEYSALVAAGALPFSVAIKLVRLRGKAMQEAVPIGSGGMAAVLGVNDDQAVVSACEIAQQKAQNLFGPKEVVSAANFNAPGQVVVAGTTNALSTFQELLRDPSSPCSGKFRALSVSAPFHCSLMRPARRAMSEEFGKIRSSSIPADLSFPYIANCSAEVVSDSEIIISNLEEQIEKPVLWRRSFELLLQLGFFQGLEIGPGKVLQGLAKRIADSVNSPCDLQSVGDVESLRAFEKGARK